MSVIDSLVIELGLDGSKFSKGQKQAVSDLRGFEKQAEKTGRDVADSGDRAAEFFSKVRREALGMFAVFTAGRSIKAFTGDVTKSNVALGAASRQIGISAQHLYQMNKEAEAAGGSFGEVTQSYHAMMTRLRQPGELANVTNIFRQLGLSQNEWYDRRNGNMRENISDLINEGIRRKHLDSGSATLLMERLNLGTGQINQAFLDQAELARRHKQYAGLGPTAKQIADSEKLLDDWTALTAQSEKLGRTILGDLTPALDAVAIDVTTLLKKFDEWSKDHPDRVKEIAEVTARLLAMGAAVTTLGGLITAFARLRALRTLFALPSAIRAATLAAGGGGAATAATEAEGALLLGRLTPAALLALYAVHPEHTANNDTLSPSKRAQLADITKDDTTFGVYAKTVAGIERARYDQMGGAGNAYAGKYQMGRGAIADAAHRLNVSVPSQAQFLADPGMQERFFKAYTEANEATLNMYSSTFRGMTPMQKFAVLGYAHNQGAGGALDWMKTGAAGKDAFGTPGDLYATRILDNFDRQKDLRAFANRQQGTIAGPSGNAGNTNTVHTGDIVINTPSTDPHRHGEIIQSILRRQLPIQTTNGMQ